MLFDKLSARSLHLANHKVLAPMTRSRATTAAVHANVGKDGGKEGGKMFVQFMHRGRVAHMANLPSGACRFQAESPRSLRRCVHALRWVRPCERGEDHA